MNPAFGPYPISWAHQSARYARRFRAKVGRSINRPWGLASRANPIRTAAGDCVTSGGQSRKTVP